MAVRYQSEDKAVVYRGRRYQGDKFNGYNAIMKEGARNIQLVSVINFITKEERPFAVIKTVFQYGRRESG